jgi:multidrug efflux pump subunit AcrB
MYMFGFSINVLTLLAIVLATGLVVDDGIVVTENIFRKLESGMKIRQAAKEGTDEIVFAVLSTSITLAAVFLPVIFLQGFVGSLFREFGVVIAAAVLISAFVSLTLTPVLSVWLQRGDKGPSKFYRATEPFFTKMESGYGKLLERFMRMRWIALVILALSGLAIFFVGKNLPSELAPLEDRGSVRFTFSAAEGTAFDYMDKFVDQVALFVRDSVPEMEHVFASANNPFLGTGSPNTGFGRVVLSPPGERLASQQDITNRLNGQLKRFLDGRIFLIQEQTISVGLGSRNALPVQFVIQHPNLDSIKKALPLFLAKARSNPVFQMVDANLKFNKPELEVSYDRIRARDLGLTVADINEALQASLSGRRAGYFTMNGRQYQVIAQLDRENRDDPADLDHLYVRNNRGENVPMRAVMNVDENSNPPQLYHYNRYKSATISASLVPGKTVGDGVKAMEAIADTVLGSTFQTALTGPSRDFAESSSNTMFALLLALLLIYLILSAQFESFIDPFTIMLTVPLAMAGALLSLWLTGNTLNIFSQIGMIMLIGLVAKNGILIVEFANQKRERGMSRREAVVEAASQRLRPILMTSLATALGALPIALSLGASATSRIPLGVVVVGGIMFSLVLTLVVIPAMYTYLVLPSKSSKSKDALPDPDTRPAAEHGA